MRTASPHQPSTERTDGDTSPTGVARSAPLKALGQVKWHLIKDSTGSATDIPLLLDRVARGDAQAAEEALEDLRRRICQYNFVVEQATAATVPFLWELAQSPAVACRARIINLLKYIADARQWENTAAVYPKLLNHRENHVVWERAARQAVRERRPDLAPLLAEEDGEITRATAELARALGD
jgi:hypothetical protein